MVSTLPDNGKKKTARRKKKKSIDSVSQITDSFAKLDVKSKSAKSSKKLAKYFSRYSTTWIIDTI